MGNCDKTEAKMEFAKNSIFPKYRKRYFDLLYSLAWPLLTNKKYQYLYYRTREYPSQMVFD